MNGKRVEISPHGGGTIELFEISPKGKCIFHAVIEEPEAKPEAGWNGFRREYLDSAASRRLQGGR